MSFDFNTATPEEIRVEAERRRLRKAGYNGELPSPKDGRYSDEQLLFAADCREAGIDVIGGGVDEAQAQLERLGLTLADGP